MSALMHLQVRDLQEVLSLLQPDQRIRIKLGTDNVSGDGATDRTSELIPEIRRDCDGVVILDFSE